MNQYKSIIEDLERIAIRDFQGICKLLSDYRIEVEILDKDSEEYMSDNRNLFNLIYLQPYSDSPDTRRRIKIFTAKSLSELYNFNVDLRLGRIKIQELIKSE